MLSCCRRRSRPVPTLADAEAAIDRLVGDEPDAAALQKTMAQVLASVDSLLTAAGKRSLTGIGLKAVEVPCDAPPQALAIFSACGFGRVGESQLRAHSDESLDVLQSARGLVNQLLLSLQEAEAELVTEAAPKVPEANQPATLAAAQVPEVDQTATPAATSEVPKVAPATTPAALQVPEVDPAAQTAAAQVPEVDPAVTPVVPQSPSALARTADASTTAHGESQNSNADVMRAARLARFDGGDSRPAAVTPPAAGPDPSAVASPAATSAAAPAVPRPASPTPPAAGHDPATARTSAEQRATAPPLAARPPSSPKVVSFQRFDVEKVCAGFGLGGKEAATARVEQIRSACRASGNQFVDNQFPPSSMSLYLSAEEEHTWQCLSCQAHSKLPPVPPLAKSREEAQQQEQDFKNSVSCEGCGLPPHYIVQVRYFTRPTQWLRPGHTCEGCELLWGSLQGDLAATMCTHYLRDSVTQAVLGTPWKVIREAARPDDVCQGALGNCWFAGALSVVAQLPQLIDRLFVTKEWNSQGVYHLRLCHAGQWVDLVVDDLFPTSQVCEGFSDGQVVHFSRGGNLCYLGGARRQLWPPLVEKAAAKLWGSYGSLKGGTLGEALALFTGCPTQRLRLYVPKAQRAAKDRRRQASQARRMQLLMSGADVPDEPSDDSEDDDDLTWSKLLSCKDAGYLMGMGCSEEGCEKTKHHIVEEMGLQAPHAYGVLDLKEVRVSSNTVRLVKIRNPWGSIAPRTWKGKWGKDWEGWTPELQQELGVANSSGVLMDDPMSIFWMQFEDVKEYFPAVEICRVHTGWHEVREAAWLPSAVGPGQAFDLVVSQRTNIDIAIWQERHVLREGALGARCTNVDCGIAIMRSRGLGPDGFVQYDLIDYCVRCFDDCASTEVILEGGFAYRVVPVCLGLIRELDPRKALLTVHSVQPVELRRVESTWREVAAAVCGGVKRRGRRWAHGHQHGLTYWHLFEPGGGCLVVENNTACPAAVQVDASDSIGCLSTRGELGVVARVGPHSQRLVLGLAFSPGYSRAAASIQPQPVPLEMAALEDVSERDGIHMSLPLSSPAAVLAPMAAAAAAAAADSSEEKTPVLPAAAGVLPTPGDGCGGRECPAPVAPAAARKASQDPGTLRLVPDEDEEDLTEAIRLSLVVPAPSSAANSPDEAKKQLQQRTKELFALFRNQGVAPNEAAARAADEARRSLGIAAVTA
eukprot:TRINITY_DN30430_c0_g1_i1.p1 TRINITY_DN30430_c0_g1~~TRINITY_DN30430_c0_g1_i1.p1  ORF type:complete len:1208 (-),score=259.03 TRINITY_DN30430_c0_g1_i1:36-3659(-)